MHTHTRAHTHTERGAANAMTHTHTNTHTQVLLLEANIDQAKKAGAAQAVEVMTMLRDKAGKLPRSTLCLPPTLLPISVQGQGGKYGADRGDCYRPWA